MAKLNKADVCIIGSGAGGGVVAKELSEQGISVVVLEAGKRFNPIKDYEFLTLSDWERAGTEHNTEFRAPKMGRITLGVKNTHAPTTVYGVGGGTLRYHGHCIRMLPSVFRTYTIDGVGMDWPITYEDLIPYYRKVELELGVSGQNGGPWFPNIEEYPNPPFEFSYSNKILKKSFDKLGIRLWPRPVARLSLPFDGRPACVNCGKCGYGCIRESKSSVDVTYISKAESTGKVEIRTESVTTRIKLDSKGRAKSVIYFDKNDVEHECEAKIIIVSAGSIQSPRLLLNSKSSLFPDGLANSSGLVGKNLMQHLWLSSYALLPDRVDSFRGFGGASSFDFARTDKRNSFVHGWSIAAKNYLKGPVKMAIDTHGWGAQHKDYMRKNLGCIAGLSTLGEQLPNDLNRVELDQSIVDHYGMPVPRITLGLSSNDKLMLEAMGKKLREIYSAAKATKILIKEYTPGQGVHNMGTCRMGNKPTTSVVNSFCQCHDVRNLFVIDASVFVTNGTSNPSLTIQAIATRAAEYIIEESKSGNL